MLVMLTSGSIVITPHIAEQRLGWYVHKGVYEAVAHPGERAAKAVGEGVRIKATGEDAYAVYDWRAEDFSEYSKAVVYVRGKGKYILKLHLQRGEKYYMYVAEFEAGDDWEAVEIDLSGGVELGFGMLEREGAKLGFKFSVMPYRNRETGEVHSGIDLEVSPVFFRR